VEIMILPDIPPVGKGLALAGLLLLLLGAPARAEPAKPNRAETSRAAQALAATIDEHMTRRWKDNHLQPAPPADDAEFLRRVYLDLAGRIPSAGEARRFLDDKKPDKRQQLVEDLLGGPAHVTHWVHVWRTLLLPELKTIEEGPASFFGRGGYAFEAWLRKQLEEDAGYDRVVRELLTAPVESLTAAGTDVFGPVGTAPSPMPFYLYKKAQPENLAGSTARLFLGVRIECAQCHDHPFGKWKREQFWGQAAFFAGLEAPGDPRQPRPLRDNPDKREISVPGTDKVVPARFLDGTAPKWQDKISARQALADWITAPNNPYFARAAANRLWAYFLGTGLKEPVDEMVGDTAQDNDPTGLLNELATALVAHDFDMKFLMRAITASKVYQLASARVPGQEDNPREFTHVAVRGLTAEQLFDSLALATGYRERPPAPDVIGVFPAVAPAGVPPSDPFREQFLARLANPAEKATESQTSIQQALALMNGAAVAGAHSPARSRTVTALVDLPLLSTADRVETLYLATLSRKPRPAELERMVKYVDQGGAREDGKDPPQVRALGDVLWVLLNCAEFKVNH
jgi:hypothetical protein